MFVEASGSETSRDALALCWGDQGRALCYGWHRLPAVLRSHTLRMRELAMGSSCQRCFQRLYTCVEWSPDRPAHLAACSPILESGTLHTKGYWCAQLLPPTWPRPDSSAGDGTSSRWRLPRPSLSPPDGAARSWLCSPRATGAAGCGCPASEMLHPLPLRGWAWTWRQQACLGVPQRPRQPPRQPGPPSPTQAPWQDQAHPLCTLAHPLSSLGRQSQGPLSKQFPRPSE